MLILKRVLLLAFFVGYTAGAVHLFLLALPAMQGLDKFNLGIYLLVGVLGLGSGLLGMALKGGR